MLGDVISETKGKRIVRRMLGTDPPKVEVSFEDSGQMLGTAVTGFGTYWAVVRPDGRLYGEGEGASTTQDGELVTWKGTAQGHFGPGGDVSYRGILFFRRHSLQLPRESAL